MTEKKKQRQQHFKITWPIAKISDTKKKLILITKNYARNQTKLLNHLADSSEEIITLGTQALAATEMIGTLEIQMKQVRLSSLAVIHASSDRRRLARLLRVWHTWFLKQRTKRRSYRAERRVVLIQVWASWCQLLAQSKYQRLYEQHLFLIQLQDRHALEESYKIINRAMMLGGRRLPMRYAMRRWIVKTIEQRL